MRTKIAMVRLTKRERAAWQAEADKAGMTLSAWIRAKCEAAKL